MTVGVEANVSGYGAATASPNGVGVAGGVAVSAQPRVEIDRAAVSEGFQSLPMRIGVRYGFGFTTSLASPALDGLAQELGGHIGYVPRHWLSLEAHVNWLRLLHRVTDADRNGVADVAPPMLSGVQLAALARFRVFEDTDFRNGWSFGLGPGVLIPIENAAMRGVGPTAEALVARHLGRLGAGGGSWDLSLELRGRTGFANTGDYQSLQLSLAGALEGGQRAWRSSGERGPGYAPGQSWGVEAFLAPFIGASGVPGTGINWNRVGGGVALHAGLILAGPFELLARFGYVGRGSSVMDADALHIAVLEAAARLRWGWTFAEFAGGVMAPFGTYRDAVRTTAHVGGGLGVRVAFDERDRDGMRFVAAARTRVGLFDDLAMAQLTFGVGVEWEGGRHAPAFPSASASAPGPVYLPPARTPNANANANVGGEVRPSQNLNPGGVANNSQTPPAGANARPAATGTGATYNRVPIGVSLGMDFGMVFPMRGLALMGQVLGPSIRINVAPTRWFSIDARAAFLHAPGAADDTDGNGVADVRGGGWGAFSLVAGPRFRWYSDVNLGRYGWTLGLYAGAFVPTGGLDPRGTGFVLEGAIGRTVGMTSAAGTAVGFELEARARTGVGNYGDLQTLTFGLSGWYEGNVFSPSQYSAEPSGWRPGSVFSFDGGGLIFTGGNGGNGRTFGFDLLGGTLGMNAGIVLHPVLDLSARIGWMLRRGGSSDDLSAIQLEAGPRFRYGWLAVQPFAGWSAVYGTFADEVRSGAYAGGLITTRFASDTWNFEAGIVGRFGITADRALDHIGLRLAVEYEGGPHHAPRFPSRDSDPPAPSPQPVVATTRVAPPPGYLPPAARPAQVVTARDRFSAGERPAVGASGGASFQSVPLRFSLGFGAGVNTRGLHRLSLDGGHYAFNFGVGYAPRDWVLLALDASLQHAGGHLYDRNLDGFSDAAVEGTLNFGLTFGPRFRLLSYDHARFGWSFGFGAGLLATGVGAGPMGELVLGRHFGTLGWGSVSFDVEARGRLGYVPGSLATEQGNLFSSLTVGLGASFESGVRPNASANTPARRNAWSAGETLSLELGLGLGLSSTLRTGQQLQLTGPTVGLRTGIVFSPGFEWSIRGGYFSRAASGDKRDSTHVLFAEMGPRFRYGWIAAEVFGGYGGMLGTFRDSAEGVPLVGASVLGRFLLNGPEKNVGLTIGIQARFGASSERAYDMLALVGGLEFEGGRNQAAPFPVGRPEQPRPVERPAEYEGQRTTVLPPSAPPPPPPQRLEIPTRIEVRVPTQVQVEVGPSQ